MELRRVSTGAVVKAFLRDLNAFYSSSMEFYENIKDFSVVFVRDVRDAAIFE